MKKAISYWSFKSGLSGEHPINEAMAEAGEIGFESLELCIGTDGVLTVDSPRDYCEAIRKNIDKSEVTVQTLASGMSWVFNPTSEDSTVRERSLELHEKALESAAWLGCQSLLYVPGVVNSPIMPDEHIRYDHALKRCRENVGRLLKTAERVGVDLCIENVWNGLFYSPLELADFIDSFGHERLGVYFDIGNVLGYQQYPPHWIDILGSRIRRVHVKDFKHNFDWSGSYEFCQLGEGDVPWDETLSALRAVGYDKTVVAEMLPYKPGQLETTEKFLTQWLAG